MMFRDAGALAGFDLLAGILDAAELHAAGILTLEGGSGERIRFQFRDAKLVALDVPERLLPGAVLVRAGKLAQSALDGLSVAPGEDRFAVAVRSGVVTPREEQWARKMSAIEALAETVSWGEGSYQFTADAAPPPVTVDLSITRWVLELILRSRDRAAVAERLGPMDSAIERTDRFGAFADLGLTADADAIVALIDGRRSAAEILRKARSDEFAVMKLLAAMRTLGLTRTAIEAPPFPELPAEESLPIPGDVEPPEVEPIPLPIPLPAEPESETSPPPEGEKSVSGPFEVPIPPEPSPPREIPLPLFALTAPDAEERAAAAEIEMAPPETEPSGSSRSTWIAGLAAAVLIAAGVLFFSRTRPKSVSPGSPVPRAASKGTESRQPAKPAAPSEAPAPRPAAAVPKPAPVQKSGNVSGAISAMVEKGNRQFANPGRFRYAIQLELACEETTVTRALREDPERRFLWIASREFRGRSCYRVLWGRYQTIGEARAAREKLPGLFREGGNRPAVIALGEPPKSRK